MLDTLGKNLPVLPLQGPSQEVGQLGSARYSFHTSYLLKIRSTKQQSGPHQHTATLSSDRMADNIANAAKTAEEEILGRLEVLYNHI